MQLQSYSSKLNDTITANPTEAIQTWLTSKLAEQLSLDTATINVSEPLTRYGLDSIDAVTIVGDLEDWLELELPSTLFWDYPTIAKSAQYLSENYDIAEALANAAANEEQATGKELAEPVSSNKGLGSLWGRLTGAWELTVRSDECRVMSDKLLSTPSSQPLTLNS